MVTIGGHTLVVGNQSFSLSTTDDAVTQIQWTDNGDELNLTKGELAGIIEARDTVIPDQIAKLDELASTLVTQVNNIHYDGYAEDGTNHHYFFDPSGTSALTIQLDDDILESANNIAASVEANSPGDGNLAIEIANIRDELVMNGGLETINGYYTRQITELGLEIQQAQNLAEDHQDVANSLQSYHESVAGVNLDEEATNLLKYQKAYEALARVLTTIDEMLNTLINSTGLVGR